MINSESDKTTTIFAPCDITINKWRCREGGPLYKSKIILDYTENEDDTKEMKSIKAPRKGILRKKCCSEKEVVPKGGLIMIVADCEHSTVVKDMCASCGEDLRYIDNGNVLVASVPMLHAEPEVKVSVKRAREIGYADTCSLLEQRKLALLVDLDQTIIHTTNDNVPNNIKDIHHFQLYGAYSAWYHTRLRPFTKEFLERISKYYELHICTFGARNYAHKIARIIDPVGQYFGNRILSRDECLNSIFKTDNIKALFPNGDSMVCIIDDREDVWNSASNLVHVKPYHFFNNTGDINAPPGFKHELDGKEGLTSKEISKLAKKNKDKATETADRPQPKELKTTQADDLVHVEELIHVDESENSEDPEHAEEPLHVNSESENMPLLNDANADENSSSGEKETKENVEIEINEANEAMDVGESEKLIKTQAEIDTAKDTEQENAAAVKLKISKVAATAAKTETESSQENLQNAQQIKDKAKPANVEERLKEASQSDSAKASAVEAKGSTVALKANAKKAETSAEEAEANTEQAETNAEKTKASAEEAEISAEQGEPSKEKAEAKTDNKDLLPTSSNRKEKLNTASIKPAEDPKYELELEDHDDYLLHLEVILKHIHRRFYQIYDESGEIPDLKIIVPKFRASVLSGCHFVFTGAIPTTHKLENTRHYMIARSLGAVVSHNITAEVTHLIAARPNTYKVIAARKNPKIKVVHINWLWTCAERWEHVDERLFPLDKNCKAERSAPAHCHSPEHVVNYSNKSEISSSSSAQKAREPAEFKNTLNPLLVFSPSDLADMNDDYNLFCSEDSSSTDSEDVDNENPPIEKLRKRKRREQEEFTRKLFKNAERNSMDEEDDAAKYFQNADAGSDNHSDSDSDDDELPSAKFRRGETINSDFEVDDQDSDSNQESDIIQDSDGEWNLLGAEVERRYNANE